MPSAEPESCSASALRAAEPLAGTAPVATGWLAIEQQGPFGRDPLRHSHFPVDVAEQLGTLMEGSGIRPALIRPVGRHADTHADTPTRRIFLARSSPGSSTMVTTTITDAAELLHLNLEAFAAGDLGNALPGAVPEEAPLLLVCTHAKRDVCCALRGRPLARDLALNPDFRELVWETSHLGGHRFAGNVVACPQGWFYGNLDPDSAVAAIKALDEGRLVLDHLRGHGGLSAEVQYAEIELRRHLGHDRLTGVTVLSHERGRVAIDVDGTAYEVLVDTVPGPDLLMSCRDDLPKASTCFVTLAIRELATEDPDSGGQ